MNTTAHINNVPLAHGEMTLVMARDAEEIVHHAWKLAVECQRKGLGVLVVNTGISKRRFTLGDPRSEAERGASARTAAQIVVHTSHRGDLASERLEIEQVVRDCKIGVVIIASWEWTASSYQRSRRLQFMLLELMEDTQVAAIIYSQASTRPVAGRVDRAGTGRLASMVVAVTDLRGVEVSAETTPKPAPIVVHHTSDRDAMEQTIREATQLLANEQRGLEGDVVRKGLVFKQFSRSKKVIRPSVEVNDISNRKTE